MAIVGGNTFVLKPAERDPSSAMHIAELALGGAKNHTVVMPDAVVAGLRVEIAKMKVGPGAVPGMVVGRETPIAIIFVATCADSTPAGGCICLNSGV